MQNRSIGKVIALSLITFGIYSIYLLVKTKGEMNRLGANIPTAWLIIVPFVNYWWYWKYSEGVEQVTNKEISTVLSFILLILLSGVGQIILQVSFNKVGVQGISPAGDLPQPAVNPDVPTDPVAPIAPAMPVEAVVPVVPISLAPVENMTPTFGQTTPTTVEQPNAVSPQPTSNSVETVEPADSTPPESPISPSNPV